jgi:hypothetical protein
VIWISAPHFTAGAVAVERDGYWSVTRAAPIIAYMVGWDARRAWDYARGKGWRTLWLPPAA